MQNIFRETETPTIRVQKREFECHNTNPTHQQVLEDSCLHHPQPEIKNKPTFKAVNQKKDLHKFHTVWHEIFVRV